MSLQREVRALLDAGAHAIAMEVSSIGLQQGRLNGMKVDVALFTNLTRDHLDYHGTMQRYEAAKSLLFDWPTLSHAVINIDDAAGPAPDTEAWPSAASTSSGTAPTRRGDTSKFRIG